MSKKRLTLGKDEDIVIGGVCSGISEYLDTDPVFIRIIFLILLFSGIGILPYFICWLAMPDHPNEDD